MNSLRHLLVKRSATPLRAAKTAAKWSPAAHHLNSVTSLLFAFAAVALTSGCATHSTTASDPFESFNRGMYQVNDTLDKAIAKPVAKGYDAAMPLPGKIMVNNFFSNLDDILVTANDVLQLKFRQGFSDGMRVVVNSTIGVGGLFDLASMRLEKHNEDFGQTLGYWGVGSGPYIVLPILGPSTLRDGVGLYVDSQPSRLRRVSHIPTRNQLYLTKLISRRAELLKQEKVLDEAVIDRYAYIRDAYLLRRQSLVYDGNPPRPEYDEYDDEDEFVPAKPAVPTSKKKAPAGLSVETHQPEFLPLEPRSSTDMAPRKIHKVWLAGSNDIR